MGYSRLVGNRGGCVRKVAARLGAARLLLLGGVIVLVIGGLLGMHTFTSNHVAPPTTAVSAHTVAGSTHAPVTTNDAVDACVSCGEHDSDGVGMMVMCGMVLLSVLGLSVLRLPSGVTVRIQRIVRRKPRLKPAPPHLRPSLIALSISRT